MTVSICPRCQQRFMRMPHSGDFVHDCGGTNASAVLKTEDVKSMGSWEDYTGSGIVQNPNLQGAYNRLQGQRAGIEGENFDGVTKHGNRLSTHRTRNHMEYIE